MSLELRFLSPDVIAGRSTPTEKRLARVREDIDRAAAGIRAGRFPGEPAYRACRFCPYAGICPEKRSE